MTQLPRIRRLEAADIDDLAIGSAVLGTGGGGDPYIGKLIARHAIEGHGSRRGDRAPTGSPTTNWWWSSRCPARRPS